MKAKAYMLMGCGMGALFGSTTDDAKSLAIAGVALFVIGFLMLGYAAYNGVQE